MKDLFTEGWLKLLKELGSELPSIDLTITCQYEISGAPQGKVRYYIEIENGSTCTTTTQAFINYQ